MGRVQNNVVAGITSDMDDILLQGMLSAPTVTIGDINLSELGHLS